MTDPSMTSPSPVVPEDARVLVVHAHPDDESITTGGTIASLVERGASVTVVTATRGEGGEVIGEDLAHLEGDRSGLAAHREVELARAMQVLGVNDHRYLGEARSAGAYGARDPRRFEDSGMVWGADGHAQAPTDMPEAALCAAETEVAAGYLVAILAELDPHLVVTYASGGGYGHPDHRRVHDLTVAALDDFATSAGYRPVLLCIDNPPEVVESSFDPGQPGFDITGFLPADKIPTIRADGPMAVAQDVSAQIGKKSMAMAAHATQVMVAGQYYALSNSIGTRIGETEYFGLPMGPTPEKPYADVLEAIDPRTWFAAEASHEHDPAAGVAAPGETSETGKDTSPRGGVWALVHAVLIGLLVGVLGSLQHLNAHAFDLGGQSVVLPWGLALALGLSGVSLWHIAATYRSTALVVVTAAITSLVSFVLGQPTILPGHDLLVSANLRSVVWLFGPMVLAAILAFGLPSLKRPRA